MSAATSTSSSGSSAITAAATAPIAAGQAAQAKRELARMRRALMAWLKARATNDAIANGNGAALARPLLKRPGAVMPAPAVMTLKLCAQRPTTEQALATRLYQLLGEVFDASTLPSPDLSANPNAAVDLAKIALSGKLPAETAPTPTGAAWVWPVVIVVGAIAIVIMTQISSSADLAAQQEQIQCIEAGACTDSGFWMKVGAIAVASWIVWDKFGVGDAVRKQFTKGGR